MEVGNGLVGCGRVFSVASPEPVAGEGQGNACQSELEAVDWVRIVQDLEST